jgi:hypothetical protein
MGTMQRTNDCTEEGVGGSRLKGLAQRAHLRYVCCTPGVAACASASPADSMLLHTRLFRGIKALSSSTPSLLRLSSTPRPTTRPSLPPRPKIRSFGHGPSCLSCTCTAFVVWLPVLAPVPPFAHRG